jgi:hypothetical protein
MDSERAIRLFSERYGRIRTPGPMAADDAESVTEHHLQCLWYDQMFLDGDLRTAEGHRLTVLSPGWWNHQEGPDFKGAQIEFNGALHTGDVEVHLAHGGWNAHGHQLDARYDGVILHVVLDPGGPATPIRTASGRRIATLSLGAYLREDVRLLADTVPVDEYPAVTEQTPGRCSELLDDASAAPLQALLDLAGEWRMLHKARALRERMDRAGPDQAVYEALLYACGYSHFKHHFRAIARQLHYERARQLAQRDAMLLEAAFFQLGGLLPNDLPEGTTAAPYFARLRGLRTEYLAGLRTLPLTWRRVGVRPTNFPERRLSGAAHVLARTAGDGLLESIDAIWREDLPPMPRQKAFEALFPPAMGFWSAHCTWTGKQMARATAPIGAGRIRSILGNVFIPAGLAIARRDRDRDKEERVFAFFTALPAEPENRILKVMGPRLLHGTTASRMSFQTQQGMLQVYQDWCENNPSCRNCTMLRYLGEPGGYGSV